MAHSTEESYSGRAGTPNAALAEDAKALRQVLDEVGTVVVGQQGMTEALLIGLLTGGHVLLEGLPGLAKTLAVKTLADTLDAKFHRIQFTPDLIPSDLIGTVVYREKTGDFVPKKGPIFANIVLADEINRAPAKVQSALLEAMAELQVTIGEETYPLDDPFLVLATMNPIEQDGTYRLPEAQLDRFMMKVRVDYPTRAEERLILDRMAVAAPKAKHALTTREVLAIRGRLAEVYVDERIRDYVVRLVVASRPGQELSAEEASPERLRDVRAALHAGLSPRATLFLVRAARARALLAGRTYVVPEDIKAVAPDVLRHRILLTFEAQARGTSQDDVVKQLLDAVTVP
jgi:MoxR-like ATPase